jgi:hypothetical protein
VEATVGRVPGVVMVESWGRGYIVRAPNGMRYHNGFLKSDNLYALLGPREF